MMTPEQLIAAPEGVDAIQQTIADLDMCFLHGFVGTQQEILTSLPYIFQGTPLEQRIQESVQALAQNTFAEAHFVTLAAVRIALQGTLHDALRSHALTALGRASASPITDFQSAAAQSDPLLDSVRHWLMELAMTGFARLEPGTVTSFASPLAQLRANPSTAPQAALLTGFLHELLGAMPIKSADSVPLLRWCDLWSSAMLRAFGLAQPPAPVSVRGTLYPLGVELHHHSRAASVIVYAILLQDDALPAEGMPQFVRQTWSAYKATAIQGDEVWLLFPDAQMLLQHFLEGKSVILQDMHMLPSGDLLWDANAAGTGKKFKPLEIALEYCAAGKALLVEAVPPLERHPVQLAEPIALSDYRIENHHLHLKEGSVLALDKRRTALPPETLASATTLFGLLRYDAGEWSVQALTAGKPSGKFEFVGQEGVELLKKPPKTSTVSILQERASRLLRK